MKHGKLCFIKNIWIISQKSSFLYKTLLNCTSLLHISKGKQNYFKQSLFFIFPFLSFGQSAIFHGIGHIHAIIQNVWRLLHKQNEQKEHKNKGNAVNYILLKISFFPFIFEVKYISRSVIIDIFIVRYYYNFVCPANPDSFVQNFFVFFLSVFLHVMLNLRFCGFIKLCRRVNRNLLAFYRRCVKKNDIRILDITSFLIIHPFKKIFFSPLTNEAFNEI